MLTVYYEEDVIDSDGANDDGDLIGDDDDYVPLTKIMTSEVIQLYQHRSWSDLHALFKQKGFVRKPEEVLEEMRQAEETEARERSERNRKRREEISKRIEKQNEIIRKRRLDKLRQQQRLQERELEQQHQQKSQHEHDAIHQIEL